MIFISALIWKRWVELKNSKKIIVFILLPILCLGIFYYLRFPTEKLFFYFPTVVTYLSIFIHWNPENLIYSGYLLSTPLTPKKNWICNSLIITLSSYVYAYTILVLFSFIFNIALNISTILSGFINLPFAFSIVLSSTLYFVDYSILKQYLQVPFSLFGLTIVISAFFFPNILLVNAIAKFVSIMLSIIIIIFCLLINKSNNPETLFVNTKKTLDIYTGNMVDE